MSMPPHQQQPRPLPRPDERAESRCYVALTTPHGWQLLLEHGERYLRWVLRGPLGAGGQAWPDTDVAGSSLERPGGGLDKPAIQREGNEVGHYRNLRIREGEPVELGECLEQGVFELEFDGPELGGCWQLTRSGQSRREQETWTLRPLTGAPKTCADTSRGVEPAS
jgi:hypothetical protein